MFWLLSNNLQFFFLFFLNLLYEMFCFIKKTTWNFMDKIRHKYPRTLRVVI